MRLLPDCARRIVPACVAIVGAILLVLSGAAPAVAQQQLQPFVEMLTPKTGPVTGGNEVVVQTDPQNLEITEVRFGTKTATIKSIFRRNPLSHDVTVIVPPGTAPGMVQVTVKTTAGWSIPPAGGEADYTYTATQTQNNTNGTNNAGAGVRDPLNDPQIRALVAAQASALRRLTSGSTDAVHRRMEMLHEDDVPNVVNTISIAGGPTDLAPSARYYDDPLMRNSTMGLQAINSAAEMPRMKPAEKTKPQPQPVLESPYKVWVSGNFFFGNGHGNTMSGASKNKFALSGLAAGFDTDVMPGFKGGFALNLADDVNDLGADGGRVTNRNIGGSLYGSWRIASGFHVDSAFGYGYLSITSRRVDTAGSSLYSGDRSGHGFNGSVALSYDYKYDAMKIAAYSRLDATYATLASYTETGGVDALAYRSASVTGQSAALGLRGEYPLEQEWGTLVPFGRAEYRRLFSGALNQTMSYTDTPTTTYQLSNTGFDRDIVTGTLGLEARNGKDLSASMEYLISGGVGGVHGQGMRGSLRVSF